jgi:hypothetical protein
LEVVPVCTRHNLLLLRLVPVIALSDGMVEQVPLQPKPRYLVACPVLALLEVDRSTRLQKEAGLKQGRRLLRYRIRDYHHHSRFVVVVPCRGAVE